MSSLKAKGELADKVTGKAEEFEELKLSEKEEPLVGFGVSWQTLPTAQVELSALSEALKIVSCGLAKVMLRPVYVPAATFWLPRNAVSV